jgi:hypothetical protein
MVWHISFWERGHPVRVRADLCPNRFLTSKTCFKRYPRLKTDRMSVLPGTTQAATQQDKYVPVQFTANVTTQPHKTPCHSQGFNREYGVVFKPYPRYKHSGMTTVYRFIQAAPLIQPADHVQYLKCRKELKPEPVRQIRQGVRPADDRPDHPE